jgi:DNA-binding transcriptional MerR regulator
VAAATQGLPSRAFMSIGEVLGQLRPEFADITISKIRFLEDEGLIKPERTSSGYRKFSREDVGRLRYVLAAQRDHYLPLRVIKEHLDAIDRGLEPPALGGGGPKVPRALVAAEGMPGPDAFRPDASEIRLSRRELLDAAGLEAPQLEQLEQYGLVGPTTGTRSSSRRRLPRWPVSASRPATCVRSRLLRSARSAWWSRW